MLNAERCSVLPSSTVLRIVTVFFCILNILFTYSDCLDPDPLYMFNESLFETLSETSKNTQHYLRQNF
jgi:hypothetical protein